MTEILKPSTINNWFANKECLDGQEKLEAGGQLLVTLDTQASLQRIPTLANLPVPTQITEEFNQKIISALQSNTTPPLTVIEEKPFYQSLSSIFDQAVIDANEANSRVVNLDRFIKSSNQTTESYSSISIGRTITADNKIVVQSRAGELPLPQQLADLKQEMLEQGQDSILIVDDGLWDIPCLEDYKLIFEAEGIKIAGYYVGVGLYGDEEKDTLTYLKNSGQLIKSTLPAKNLEGWFCGRDLMFCGGKLYAPENNDYPYTLPYFSPFSKTFETIVPPENLISFSQKVLEANIDLVSKLDAIVGRQLVFQDLLDAGYGLLACSGQELPPSRPENAVVDYLTRALISLNSDFSRFFTPTGFNQLRKSINSQVEAALNDLDTASNKLIIFFGSSGVGRSTLAAEFIKQKPGSQRIKRTTTRKLRSASEATEIIPTPTSNFLAEYRVGQIITANNYQANNQLYGVSLEELNKLKAIPANGFGVIEGTGDVLQLKKIFPNSTLIVVLPLSQATLETRIASRPNVNNSSQRLNKSLEELSITTDNLSQMTNQGIVDIVLINQNPKQDIQKLIQTLKIK